MSLRVSTTQRGSVTEKRSGGRRGPSPTPGRDLGRGRREPVDTEDQPEGDGVETTGGDSEGPGDVDGRPPTTPEVDPTGGLWAPGDGGRTCDSRPLPPSTPSVSLLRPVPSFSRGRGKR